MVTPVSRDGGAGRPKKVVLIGIDSMTLDLVKRFGGEGVLPNMTNLMARGVTTEAFASLPPGTAMNWNTIATGAHPGTHGTVAMWMHRPGRPLDELESGFFSYYCKAERIWQAAERAGKKPLLLKYTTSWPPTVNHGIQVEGFADPDWSALALAPRCMYGNRDLPQGFAFSAAPPPRALPMGFRVDLRPATGWQNIPDPTRPALEGFIRLTTTHGEVRPLYALILNSRGEGYDRVIISTSKNVQDALANIGVDEWSDWCRLEFITEEGRREGCVRYKLVALTPDAKDFRLYQSQVYPVTGWTVPPALAQDLTERIGPFQEIGGISWVYWWHWINAQEAAKLFIEELEYQIEWLSKAADYLMTTKKWDFFATQWHGIDHMDHSFLTALNPDHELHDLGTDVIRRTYELADQYIGEILKHTDEDTLIVLTSDHGHTEIVAPRWVDINGVLEKHGLLAYKNTVETEEPLETWGYTPVPKRKIDWSKTKAALIHDGYIYVNLKGREPHGIVEPEEYDQVVEQVVNIVEDIRVDGHPDRRLMQIVFRKEDAEVFGLHGELVGDVITFAKVRYRGGHHGNFHTSRAKIGSMRAMTVFAGPGIKRGVEREKAIHLIDLAPTIAAFWGIPTPRQAEGRVLRDLLDENE